MELLSGLFVSWFWLRDSALQFEAGTEERCSSSLEGTDVNMDYFFLFLGMCLKYLSWGQRSNLEQNFPLKVALPHVTEWVLLSAPSLKLVRLSETFVFQVLCASGSGIDSSFSLWSSGTEQYEWSVSPASLLLLIFSGSIWTWLLLFSCMSCPCLSSPSHIPWWPRSSGSEMPLGTSPWSNTMPINGKRRWRWRCWWWWWSCLQYAGSPWTATWCWSPVGPSTVATLCTLLFTGLPWAALATTPSFTVGWMRASDLSWSPCCACAGEGVRPRVMLCSPSPPLSGMPGLRTAITKKAAPARRPGHPPRGTLQRQTYPVFSQLWQKAKPFSWWPGSIVL